MYFMILPQYTMSLTGFYERSIFNLLVLKGGFGYLKSGTASSVGIIAGGGLSFHIGTRLVMNPMVELSSSPTN